MHWTRTATVLLAIFFSWLPATPAQETGSAPPPLLQWYQEENRPAWTVTGGALSDSSCETVVPLMATPWFEDVSDLSIEILGAEPYRVADHRGRIILIDFWASWCGPCRQELPALQLLQDDEGGAGLDVVAVNVKEPDQVAMAIASDLGLRLPVGRYNDRLAGLLNSPKLPSALLLDGEGRIRRRWSGYHKGLVGLIRQEIRKLLTGDPGGFPAMLGAGMEQGDRYGVRWSRDLSRTVGGVAVLATSKGELVVTASAGRELVTLRKDGKIIDSVDAPSGMVSLLAADITGDGIEDLIGFRRGSRTVATYDFISRKGSSWNAPVGLFSVMARRTGDLSPELIAGTLDGVLRLAPDGSVLDTLTGGPAAGAWSLVTRPGLVGFGVGTDQLVAGAVGRFGGSDQLAVAVVTRDGNLLILEAGTGSLQYRASWSGITALAARDLDADGVDELIVGSGTFVTVLERRESTE